MSPSLHFIFYELFFFSISLLLILCSLTFSHLYIFTLFSTFYPLSLTLDHPWQTIFLFLSVSSLPILYRLNFFFPLHIFSLVYIFAIFLFGLHILSITNYFSLFSISYLSMLYNLIFFLSALFLIFCAFFPIFFHSLQVILYKLLFSFSMSLLTIDFFL